MALLVLWLLGTGSCTGRIERGLTSGAHAALDRAGMGSVEVDFSGRDATLSGGAGLGAARAHRLVRQLTGVRHVEVGRGGEFASAATGNGLRIVRRGDGTLAVRGVIRAETDRVLLLDSVRRAAPPGTRVVDELGVDERAAPLADAGAVSVTGAIDSEEGRRTLIRALRVRLPVRLDDRLRVADPSTAAGSTVPTVPNPSTPEPSAPAPPASTPAEAARVQAEVDALLVGRVIEFATRSAVLTPAGAAVVDEVAPLLNRVPSAHVQIEGHTDGTGDPAANQFLSLLRAEAVRQALVARGVAADRLGIAGFGGDRPVADDATSAGRQRNRRIEFVVSV